MSAMALLQPSFPPQFPVRTDGLICCDATTYRQRTDGNARRGYGRQGPAREQFHRLRTVHDGGFRLDTLRAGQPHYPPLIPSKSLAIWMEGGRISSNSHHRCFIGLQPIFDRNGSVFGYEALCRTEPTNWFTGDSRDATHSIIRDWLLDGLYRFTGATPVFVNCTREDLIDGFVALPPLPIIAEVLETVEVDEWVLGACRDLRTLGIQIALDDFELGRNEESLIELASYVKVDFQLCGKEQRKEILDRLRTKSVQFIAEKLETCEEFETARDEGFDLFQGYYLARPILLSKDRTYTSWLNHFRLRWLSRRRRGRWRS